MSKRRRKKQPNLPKATLERARKQAGVEPEEAPEEESGHEHEEEEQAEEASIVERAARRRRLSPVQLERSRQRGELDADVIADMLENPTEIVTEEELRGEYQHVLLDLRNMGVLAGALFVLLVVLAQFI